MQQHNPLRTVDRPRAHVEHQRIDRGDTRRSYVPCSSLRRGLVGRVMVREGEELVVACPILLDRLNEPLAPPSVGAAEPHEIGRVESVASAPDSLRVPLNRPICAAERGTRHAPQRVECGIERRGLVFELFGDQPVVGSGVVRDVDVRPASRPDQRRVDRVRADVGEARAWRVR